MLYISNSIKVQVIKIYLLNFSKQRCFFIFFRSDADANRRLQHTSWRSYVRAKIHDPYADKTKGAPWCFLNVREVPARRTISGRGHKDLLSSVIFLRLDTACFFGNGHFDLSVGGIISRCADIAIDCKDKTRALRCCYGYADDNGTNHCDAQSGAKWIFNPIMVGSWPLLICL